MHLEHLVTRVINHLLDEMILQIRIPGIVR